MGPKKGPQPNGVFGSYKDDQHVYDEWVDTGFEMFMQYAKAVDSTGD